MSRSADQCKAVLGLQQPSGLTLIEVVISLFILSVISILGNQVIHGLAKSSTRVEQSQNKHRELLLFLRHIENDLATGMLLIGQSPDSQVVWNFPKKASRYVFYDSGQIQRVIEVAGFPARTLMFSALFSKISLEVHQDGRWIEFERRDVARLYRAFRLSVFTKDLDQKIQKFVLVEPQGL